MSEKTKNKDIEACRIHNLEEEDKEFTLKLTQREDNGPNSNALEYTDGPCSSRIHNLQEKVKEFTLKLTQREDNGPNSNALEYTDEPSSKMNKPKEDTKGQQLYYHCDNEKSVKTISNYFKNRYSQTMPDGIIPSSKISGESDTISNIDRFTNIDLSELDSIRIKHKIDNLIDFIKDFDQLILTTIDSTTGELKSRPMRLYGRIKTLYFYLLPGYDSSVIGDIRKDSRANLAFKSEEKSFFKWCSISGTADIITDTRMLESSWSSAVKDPLIEEGNVLNYGSEHYSRLTSIFIETKSIDYSIDNYSIPTTNTPEKLNNVNNLKSEKHHSYSTYHLSTDEIDDYIRNYCQLE